MHTYGSIMANKDIEEFLRGQFEPDERANALHDRLEKYYIDTPHSMDNRTALVHWKSFLTWCGERGITREELNDAKKNINIDLRE